MRRDAGIDEESSPSPLPWAALPRRQQVYVMTSDVYERRRRDLSPFYRHRSGVSFFRLPNCAAPLDQFILRPQSEGKRQRLGRTRLPTPKTFALPNGVQFSVSWRKRREEDVCRFASASPNETAAAAIESRLLHDAITLHACGGIKQRLSVSLCFTGML